MSLVVQKFGGTSVADTQKILDAARKAVRAKQTGHQVVVVVSAMGKNTDMLVELASQITQEPSAREMDVLLSTGEQVSVALMAMAIHSLGSKAISLTGTQIGIRTDSSHTKARIQSIPTERIRKALDDGKIVIVAGFQGVDENFNITTLGRGGSDTTAVALAAVLRADTCEIYTDVDGVYTTDPNVLPEARWLQQVSYDEMLELASLGAGVMHSRAIEFGKKFSVPIHVRNSSSDEPGTLIVAQPEAPDQPVGGAALTRNEALVTIRGVPDVPGASLSIFAGIADKNIAVDMIVQNVAANSVADISFTVLKGELQPTLEAVELAVKELGAAEFNFDADVSKISVVGLGMATQTGVADRMFRTLSDEGINILMITTSEIKISCLVKRDQAQAALAAVHRCFKLDKQPPGARSEITPPPRSESDEQAVLARLQRMEELTVDEITLDESQSLITIKDVLDQPGLAAGVFEEVSRGGVLVDMIVQSFGSGGVADLGFTVARADLGKSETIAGTLAEKLGCGRVITRQEVAKLSVSGIGMRSHTGVAIRMFKALNQAGINLEMINTSEIRVNVLVDGQHGPKALKSLQDEFADALR